MNGQPFGIVGAVGITHTDGIDGNDEFTKLFLFGNENDLDLIPNPRVVTNVSDEQTRAFDGSTFGDGEIFDVTGIEEFHVNDPCITASEVGDVKPPFITGIVDVVETIGKLGRNSQSAGFIDDFWVEFARTNRRIPRAHFGLQLGPGDGFARSQHPEHQYKSQNLVGSQSHASEASRLSGELRIAQTADSMDDIRSRDDRTPALLRPAPAASAE